MFKTLDFNHDKWHAKSYITITNLFIICVFQEWSYSKLVFCFQLTFATISVLGEYKIWELLWSKRKLITTWIGFGIFMHQICSCKKMHNFFCIESGSSASKQMLILWVIRIWSRVWDRSNDFKSRTPFRPFIATTSDTVSIEKLSNRF